MHVTTKVYFKGNHHNFLVNQCIKYSLCLLIWSCYCMHETESRYRCTLKDFIRLGNSCYFLSAEIASWQEAHFRCRDRGSQLAVLASHYEDTTLRSYLERPEFAQLCRWIGGMRAGNKWIWAAQGSEIENERNFVNEKAYHLDDTDQWMCLYMDPSNRYHWNNENCMHQFHYICEAPLAKETNSTGDASPASSNGDSVTITPITVSPSPPTTIISTVTENISINDIHDDAEKNKNGQTSSQVDSSNDASGESIIDADVASSSYHNEDATAAIEMTTEDVTSTEE